jgi:hypothetical protein
MLSLIFLGTIATLVDLLNWPPLAAAHNVVSASLKISLGFGIVAPRSELFVIGSELLGTRSELFVIGSELLGTRSELFDTRSEPSGCGSELFDTRSEPSGCGSEFLRRAAVSSSVESHHG